MSILRNFFWFLNISTTEEICLKMSCNRLTYTSFTWIVTIGQTSVETQAKKSNKINSGSLAQVVGSSFWGYVQQSSKNHQKSGWISWFHISSANRGKQRRMALDTRVSPPSFYTVQPPLYYWDSIDNPGNPTPKLPSHREAKPFPIWTPCILSSPNGLNGYRRLVPRLMATKDEHSRPIKIRLLSIWQLRIVTRANLNPRLGLKQL